MSFQDDIKLDRYNLEDEFEKQASLYDYYGEQWAEAVFQRDRAKEQLDIVKAQVSQEVRDNPTEFGLSKVTIDTVNEAVLLNEHVRNANLELNQKNKEMNILSIAREALAHKKKMIELQANWIMSASSGEPKVDKDLKEQSEERTKQKVRKTLNENQRLRRRKNDN